MQPRKKSTREALFMKNPTCRYLLISVVLLLAFLQMLTSLMYFAGVFILSDELLISPFQQYTGPLWGVTSEIKINTGVTTLVKLCLYVPVVLVAFALLALLLAAYAKDRSAASLSMACQAASSFLTLAGTIVFLLAYQSYLSWKDITGGFYVWVSVPMELATTAVLTYVSGRRLTSDWE